MAFHPLMGMNEPVRFTIEIRSIDLVEVTDEDIRYELSVRLQGGFSKRDAIDEVTAALGIARKRVYAIAVEV
jgi:predicted transcriptional regulator YheO